MDSDGQIVNGDISPSLMVLLKGCLVVWPDCVSLTFMFYNYYDYLHLAKNEFSVITIMPSQHSATVPNKTKDILEGCRD